DCCHLPGSLCDCSDSPAFSKVVEVTGLGPPQYVAQVTSRDGRLLSTVIRALDTQSDGPFCRICHEGAYGESLLSPCGRTGMLGAVHKSCLERWLSSSNTSYCELCHTEFAVEKRSRSLTEWLKDPGPRTEKWTLCCDVVCWLCLQGAQDHLQLHSHLEALGLIALIIALFTIYVLWTLVGYSPWGRTESDTTERLHFHVVEKEMATHSCSCLENPRDGGAWWAAAYGVTQSRTRLKRLSSSSSSSMAYWKGHGLWVRETKIQSH
uniref:E3 ubiquitin-protein ligase MARCHF2 n=1 Tax=Capra hircus TaxID=9925 RepID=A0A452FYI4_CAPHI